MTFQAPKPVRKTTAADTVKAVDEFMAKLTHPHKAAIEELRRMICAVDTSIAEGVKATDLHRLDTDRFGSRPRTADAR